VPIGTIGPHAIDQERLCETGGRVDECAQVADSVAVGVGGLNEREGTRGAVTQFGQTRVRKQVRLCQEQVWL